MFVFKGVGCFILFFALSFKTYSWGFYAHKLINEHAIYALPNPLAAFYKENFDYIKSKATNPDLRRSLIENEAQRHYFDTEKYGDSAIYKLPKHWMEAYNLVNKDTMHAHGTVPWTIQEVCFELTKAFKEMNVNAILKLSADLGHYVGDINVPLHTTFNYNGQFTEQKGIHAFWESRLPELFANKYSFWVGVAQYEKNIPARAWNSVERSHTAVDSVLGFERKLNEKFSSEMKYTYEQRGKMYVKTYSEEYSHLYHTLLGGQVERQLSLSIKMTADLWYTCWVNAGQPTLPLKVNEENKDDEPKDPKPIIPLDFLREEALFSCPERKTSCVAGCCGY